ncbi:2OG-Fe(II) oxygenase family protein [Candidatus Pelagibacter sp.]|nr:2OG-Fe(II) oxygenase family protein [Candidatus Pelagibacter sp.]|tara:strand:- start:7 stop:615 length:609 start_codon:yes stop_codon:yes gene_type:complete
MKILSPFGPKLGKVKIPSKIISQLNNEVNKIIESKSKIKKRDYSKKVVGQVYQEIQISKNFINKYLKKFISKQVSNYLKKSINLKPKKFIIKNLWVVRQFKNEYNPVHFHDGYVSAVGYLMVPKNLTKSKKKIYTNGTIDFINGTKTYLSNSIHNHKPKTGDMIIFPNNLMHTAYPFNVEGERRSFSFNLDLDVKTKKILNG